MQFTSPFIGNVSSGPQACTAFVYQFECDIKTIPIGGAAIVKFNVTMNHNKSQNYDNIAKIVSNSIDPNTTNNILEGQISIIKLDVLPNTTRNELNLGNNSIIPVAILGNATMDVLNINAESVCFGSHANVSLRDCLGSTGEFRDVNNDTMVDLLLNYSSSRTHILSNDTSACMSGRFNNERSLIGCDKIIVRRS